MLSIGTNLFLPLILLPLFVRCFTLATGNTCNINFPNPSDASSNKFSINSNKNTVDFTHTSMYEPTKLYDLSLSISNQLKWNKWKIASVYVKLNNLAVADTLETTGKLLYNDTNVTASIIDCNNVLQIDFQHNLPQYFNFFWKSPSFVSTGCIKFTIVLILVRNAKQLSEGKTHMVCAPKLEINHGMFSDLSNNRNCERKDKPDPVPKCNIGSTAIYRMTIKNEWNHLNHWREWPGSEFSPKLTEYLGASHSANFDLYHLGGEATQAVKNVCTNGSYELLHKHFLENGADILTIILARALLITGTTSERGSLIAINSTHHLVSFLTHLDPSPDWCTGLSRVDLCSISNDGCAWPKTVKMVLWPWDAGVWKGNSYLPDRRNSGGVNGATYTDVDPARSVVCRITKSWPSGNPFTVIKGQMQNIGQVTFSLIQEINKDRNQHCIRRKQPSILRDQGYQKGSYPKEPKVGFFRHRQQRHCQFSNWNKWSKCSKTCGKGIMMRYRKLLKGTIVRCVRKNTAIDLKESKSCNVRACPPKVEWERVCPLRLWGGWSPCNATCVATGVRYRDRVFLTDEERDHCRNFVATRQVQVCRQAVSRCRPKWVCLRIEHSAGDHCQWASLALMYYFDQSSKTCKRFTYRGCYGNLNRFLTEEECMNFCKNYMKAFPVYQDQTSDNGVDWSNDNNFVKKTRAIRCSTPVSWGKNCAGRSDSVRWYFDSVHLKCYQFQFAGCQGNGNNFRSRKVCEEECLNNGTPASRSWHTLNPITEQNTNDKSMDQIRQCVYGEWTSWSSCETDSSKCKLGAKQFRFRIPQANKDLCSSGTGLSKEIRDCPPCGSVDKDRNKPTVLQPCNYTTWSEWSLCSAKCGRGVRERSRMRITRLECIPNIPQYSDREYCYNDCWSN